VRSGKENTRTEPILLKRQLASWNPFLFWDPIAHSGGWEFRKPDGMHIRMKYPDKPCDKTCTLDEAHNDAYNPMYDPWGHFWYELVPYIVTKSAPPPGPPPFY